MGIFSTIAIDLDYGKASFDEMANLTDRFCKYLNELYGISDKFLAIDLNKAITTNWGRNYEILNHIQSWLKLERLNPDYTATLVINTEFEMIEIYRVTCIGTTLVNKIKI